MKKNSMLVGVFFALVVSFAIVCFDVIAINKYLCLGIGAAMIIVVYYLSLQITDWMVIKEKQNEDRFSGLSNGFENLSKEYAKMNTGQRELIELNVDLNKMILANENHFSKLNDNIAKVVQRLDKVLGELNDHKKDDKLCHAEMMAKNDELIHHLKNQIVSIDEFEKSSLKNQQDLKTMVNETFQRMELFIKEKGGTIEESVKISIKKIQEILLLQEEVCERTVKKMCDEMTENFEEFCENLDESTTKIQKKSAEKIDDSFEKNVEQIGLLSMMIKELTDQYKIFMNTHKQDQEKAELIITQLKEMNEKDAEFLERILKNE